MANVTRDQSSKCTAYRQDDKTWKDLPFTPNGTIGGEGCSMTCVGMICKKSPKTIYEDGFKNVSCNWSGIGNKYGKTFASPQPTYSLTKLAELLSNYPVIVGVTGHFVVAYKFVGDPQNPSTSNFSVYDPARGAITLDNSKLGTPVSLRYYK